MKKINEIIKNRKEEIEKVDKSDMAARDEYWKQIEAEIKVGRIAEKQLQKGVKKQMIQRKIYEKKRIFDEK